jgi:hypothetical protein
MMYQSITFYAFVGKYSGGFEMKDYLILALVAMIFAVLFGLFGMMVGIGVSEYHTEGRLIMGLCIAAIIVSSIGFVFAAVGPRNPKFFGFLLIVVGILQIILMTLFGVLPGVLFIVSGILLRKEQMGSH